MSLLKVEVPYSAYIGQNRAGFVFTSAYWPDDFDKITYCGNMVASLVNKL